LIGFVQIVRKPAAIAVALASPFLIRLPVMNFGDFRALPDAQFRPLIIYKLL
jgi:hypothetical protein